MKNNAVLSFLLDLLKRLDRSRASQCSRNSQLEPAMRGDNYGLSLLTVTDEHIDSI